MQKYHYTDGTNTFGPFSIEELKTKGITGDTYVWAEGMPNWVLAKSVPELSSILSNGSQPYFTGAEQTPPQFPNTPASPYRQRMEQPPKTYMLETILKTIFCCWPLVIPQFIYASRMDKISHDCYVMGAYAA